MAAVAPSAGSNGLSNTRGANGGGARHGTSTARKLVEAAVAAHSPMVMVAAVAQETAHRRMAGTTPFTVSQLQQTPVLAVAAALADTTVVSPQAVAAAVAPASSSFAT